MVSKTETMVNGRETGFTRRRVLFLALPDFHVKNFIYLLQILAKFNVFSAEKGVSLKKFFTLRLWVPGQQGWQSHRRHFAIIFTQAKCDAIMIWTNGFKFFAIIKNFLMRYYRSSFAISFCDFRFFR